MLLPGVAIFHKGDRPVGRLSLLAVLNKVASRYCHLRLSRHASMQPAGTIGVTRMPRPALNPNRLDCLATLVTPCADFSPGHGSRCSLANTLRFQQLEFGREKLAQGPDVIGDPRSHPRSAVHPFDLDQPCRNRRPDGQRHAQAPVWSRNITVYTWPITQHFLPSSPGCQKTLSLASCAASQALTVLPTRGEGPSLRWIRQHRTCSTSLPGAG